MPSDDGDEATRGLSNETQALHFNREPSVKRSHKEKPSPGFSRTNHLVHFHWPKAKKTPNRLIDIHTLELKDFPTTAPPYAILSHRWTGDEVTFESYDSHAHEGSPGYAKIFNFCRFIRELNCGGEEGKQDYTGPLVEHVWVDACCIDKRSSAELSEAVNSMAAWYKHSAFCVAYLQDVLDAEHDDWLAFRLSEWFRRGWTLQELIFPPSVVFCNRDWEEFLWMSPLRKPAVTLVSEISGVPPACLRSSRAVADESIATRLSWAATRITTRKEDEAYCLLGLLDIHMPLIYGEGERAFTRLQEEIIKQVDDESIFAWTMRTNSWRMFPILATSPLQFKDCHVVCCRPVGPRKPYSVTNQGLVISSTFIQLRDVALGPSLQDELIIIQLNCCYVTYESYEPCFIALVKRAENELYRRVHPQRDVWTVLSSAAKSAQYHGERTFYVAVGHTNRPTPSYRGLDAPNVNAMPGLYDVFLELPEDKRGSPLVHRSSSQGNSSDLVQDFQRRVE